MPSIFGTKKVNPVVAPQAPQPVANVTRKRRMPVNMPMKMCVTIGGSKDDSSVLLGQKMYTFNNGTIDTETMRREYGAYIARTQTNPLIVKMERNKKLLKEMSLEMNKSINQVAPAAILGIYERSKSPDYMITDEELREARLNKSTIPKFMAAYTEVKSIIAATNSFFSTPKQKAFGFISKHHANILGYLLSYPPMSSVGIKSIKYELIEGGQPVADPNSITLIDMGESGLFQQYMTQMLEDEKHRALVLSTFFPETDLHAAYDVLDSLNDANFTSGIKKNIQDNFTAFDETLARNRLGSGYSYENHDVLFILIPGIPYPPDKIDAGFITLTTVTDQLLGKECAPTDNDCSVGLINIGISEVRSVIIDEIVSDEFYEKIRREHDLHKKRTLLSQAAQVLSDYEYQRINNELGPNMDPLRSHGFDEDEGLSYVGRFGAGTGDLRGPSRSDSFGEGEELSYVGRSTTRTGDLNGSSGLNNINEAISALETLKHTENTKLMNQFQIASILILKIASRNATNMLNKLKDSISASINTPVEISKHSSFIEKVNEIISEVQKSDSVGLGEPSFRTFGTISKPPSGVTWDTIQPTSLTQLSLNDAAKGREQPVVSASSSEPDATGKRSSSSSFTPTIAKLPHSVAVLGMKQPVVSASLNAQPNANTGAASSSPDAANQAKQTVFELILYSLNEYAYANMDPGQAISSIKRDSIINQLKTYLKSIKTCEKLAVNKLSDRFLKILGVMLTYQINSGNMYDIVQNIIRSIKPADKPCILDENSIKLLTTLNDSLDQSDKVDKLDNKNKFNKLVYLGLTTIINEGNYTIPEKFPEFRDKKLNDHFDKIMTLIKSGIASGPTVAAAATTPPTLVVGSDFASATAQQVGADATTPPSAPLVVGSDFASAAKLVVGSDFASAAAKGGGASSLQTPLSVSANEKYLNVINELTSVRSEMLSAASEKINNPKSSEHIDTPLEYLNRASQFFVSTNDTNKVERIALIIRKLNEHDKIVENSIAKAELRESITNDIWAIINEINNTIEEQSKSLTGGKRKTRRRKSKRTRRKTVRR